MSELNTERQDAIEDVYRDQRLGLVRLAFLLTGTRDQADDIVQTAFEAAQPRWDELDDPLAFLRRVVVNQAKDLHRRRYRRRARPEPPVTHIPEIDEIWVELRRLPDRQRAVIVLRFYEDLPLTDIARLLDRPEGTVRSDLHRALAQLRRTLA
ncbi:MAG TPA: sigma-70 family RNA polymerase sigma factor [Acidimicrobiales bacterium]